MKKEDSAGGRESVIQDSREKTLRPAETPLSESKPAEPTPRGRLRPFVLLGLLALAVAAALLFGIRTVSFYRHHVETDDAQVEAHIAPVLPKISGYVTEVAVEDNQRVKAGQTVVRIDDRDFRSRVETARGALENAKATVAVDIANLAAAQTQVAKAVADLARYARLREKEEVSQQQYDAALAASDASAALT
jgi:membrane fusion protein, multidrug efflux system